MPNALGKFLAKCATLGEHLRETKYNRLYSWKKGLKNKGENNYNYYEMILSSYHN